MSADIGSVLPAAAAETELEGSEGRARPSEAELVTLLDIAVRGYQHAEAVVQARLYNFLFADSILVLSWAAVYAGNASVHKRSVLLSLALLSSVLALWWSVMGLRHRKFWPSIRR